MHCRQAGSPGSDKSARRGRGSLVRSPRRRCTYEYTRGLSWRSESALQAPVQPVPDAPCTSAQDRSALRDEQRHLDRRFQQHVEVGQAQPCPMFTAVAIHPEVDAVSPVIVAAYRRRIIDLDDTRADTAMLQCIDRAVVVSDDAGLLDKPGVAADHPLIAVNHIAPIEHIV